MDDSNWLLIIEIENMCSFLFQFYLFWKLCTEQEEEQKCEICMDWSCQPNDVGCKRKHVCQSKLNALWRNFKLQPCKCRINKFQNTQTDYIECNSGEVNSSSHFMHSHFSNIYSNRAFSVQFLCNALPYSFQMLLLIKLSE